MSEFKKFWCQGCGLEFEYEKRRPKYCDECRRLKHIFQIQRCKKKQRALLKKGDKEEKFTGASSFISQVGGASHGEIAQHLNITRRQVEELERKALMRIRANPELKDLWDTLKQELADGASLDGKLLLRPDQGKLLLEYQMTVAEWWQTHDEIQERGCTAEALECLTEIERFRQAIATALVNI